MTTSTILRQEFDGPVLVGAVEQGQDIRCHCGALLATQLHAFSVWNLAIQCRRCRALTESRSLPAGYPVPTQSVRVVKANVDAFIDQAIHIPAGGCLVGESAVHQRALELPGGSRDVVATELVQRCSELLGPSFDDTVQRYRRALTHRTPPRHVHRLARAVVAIEATTNDNEACVREVAAAVKTFDFWSQDPAWPEIRATLADPCNYIHSLINLAGATRLFMQNGGAVGLVGTTVDEGQRIADMRLLIGSRHVLVETKAPVDFQYQDQLSLRRTLRTERIVERLLKDASGQVREADAGLLFIGGVELADSELADLEAATESQLGRRIRPRLMAVAVLNLRFSSEDALADLRVVSNPHFVTTSLALVHD